MIIYGPNDDFLMWQIPYTNHGFKMFQVFAGGPQSVCLALAACCFANKASPKFWGSRGLEMLDVHCDVRLSPFFVHQFSTNPIPQY